MKKVKDIISLQNSFFNIFNEYYPEIYRQLFDTISANDLNLALLNICGDRYSSPLLNYDIKNVINYIINKYFNNWLHLKNALSFNYTLDSPNKNIETVTTDKTIASDTTSENISTNSIYGFDSEVSANADTDTTTDKGNTTNKETSTITKESSTMGNNTYPDLIRKEIEVRKTSFLSIVLNDIKSQITLDLY